MFMGGKENPFEGMFDFSIEGEDMPEEEEEEPKSK
jgi:hypothetical protein